MKKKITALALAVCILVVGIVGATMSYFTDTKEATNTFTFGKGVEITLTETAEAGITSDGETIHAGVVQQDTAGNVTGVKYDNVIPGRLYSKKPIVELLNDGRSAPAYIVVTATFEDERPITPGGKAYANGQEISIVPEKIGNTYFFYFPNPVNPGYQVSPFEWMELDGSVNNATTNSSSADFNVVVNAYAVLAAGFTDCKTAFNAAFGNNAEFNGILGEKKSETKSADATGTANFTLDTAPVSAKQTAVTLTGLTAGSDYTLDATTYDAESATVPTTFTVTDGSGVIAALDLSLTDALGNKALFADGEATVVTYIATGLEGNPTVKYTGNDSAAQPTFVSYDSDTGKLVFKTSHFSNFAVLVSEAAYNKTTNTAWKTLADAVAAAQNNDVVVLLKDVTGCGVMIAAGNAKTLTIDLNGKTYTFTDPAVGSSGTETQGFHFEKGCTITVKNGKLDAAAGNTNVKMLIQNYCDLTLDGVAVDGTNLNGTGRYVLSNNCGTTIIKNSTITAKEGDFAFDSCKFSNYTIPTVKLDNATINGNVELTGGKLEFDGNLTLTNGRIDVYGDKYAEGLTIDLNNKKITRTGGNGNGSAFEVKSGNVTIKNGTIDCTGVTGTTNNQGSPYDVETDAITVRAGETTLENLKVDVVSKTGACAYAFDGGKIYVKSGTYSNAASEQFANDNKMLLNQADNKDQAIFVSGGTFYGANPAGGDNSGNPASFLVEGATVTGGTGYWTVTYTAPTID